MLRAVTLADLRVVASWLTSPREVEFWAGPRVRFPIDLHTLPTEIQLAPTNGFALGKPDGLVAFGQLLDKPGDRGHLARLIVCPEFRGLGYGEALVRALVAEARSRSCARVSLNVHSANLPAARLYWKLGFRNACRPADEPGSEGSVYMELRTEHMTEG